MHTVLTSWPVPTAIHTAICWRVINPEEMLEAATILHSMIHTKVNHHMNTDKWRCDMRDGYEILDVGD